VFVRRPVVAPWLTALVAVAVVGTGLVLPVAELPGPADLSARPAVDGSLQELPVDGVDARVVAESEIAMAAWQDPETAALDAVPALAPLEASPSAATVAARPLKPAVATRAMSTKDFGLVGIAADSPLDPDSRVLVRVREDGVWSAWTPLSVHDDHGPDPDSREADRARFGTDPLLTGDADGVQVRIDTPDGVKPKNPSVVLLDNPVTEEDADLPMPDQADLPGSTVAAATIGAPMPPVITRAMWGADESKRNGSTKYAGTIKAAFIHHTASTNEYTPEQAAKQVRNLYQWFTRGLKYDDMAYNFLIDRYGRLYEGRSGGMDQAVIGGHTAGFNVNTFAVSAIGDFRRFRPNPVEQAAINESLSSLLAWKLSLFQRDPNGSTVLTSDSGAGTSRYQPGQQASALVVGGHGDIGNTSCPGAVLSSQIPTIRAMAASKMGVTMFNPSVAAAVPYAAPEAITVNTSTTAPLAWSMTVRSKCGDVVRSLSGQQEGSGPLSVGWDKLSDAGEPVPPGDYTLTLAGTSGGDGTYPWTGTARVLPTVDSPADPCAAPSQFTITGAGYGHGVGMSQWGAYGMAKAGYDAVGIASYYYSGTTVAPVQDDMEARINLLYRVSGAKMRTEALDPSGGAIEVTVGPSVTVGGPADEFRFLVDGPNVKVKRVAGGQKVDLGSAPSVTVRWAGTRNPGAAAGGPTLLNVVGGGSSLDSSGHRYRYGSVDVVPVSTSNGIRLNVVNSVRIHDEYLYGISEVSSSWPKAAMQAQVLAARTYALSKVERGVRQGCSCHMDDGGGPYYDQTFTGWTKASSAKGDRWVEAVNTTLASDTTGLAILYDGKPISAFYHSSSGGATQSVQDVWGGTLPYVVSVPDPWMANEDNPNRSWSVDVSQAKMAQAFGVREVWKLDFPERYVSGAVKTAAATLADGSVVTMTGSKLQRTLGLKSTFYSADGSAVAPAPAPAPEPAPEAAPETAPTTVKQRTVSLLTPAAISVKKGKKYKVVGLVRPAKKGLKAWRQLLVDGEWQTKAKTRTTKKGRYRFVVKKARPKAVGTYRVLVVRKKSVVGVSPEFTVGLR
jgi:SpoIID/LytB domain protein